MKCQLTISNRAILTGVDGQVVSKLRKILTIDNPKFIEAQKYDRWTDEPELLRFYELVEGGIAFPRGFLRKAFDVLVSASVEAEIDDQTLAVAAVDYTFSGSLRDYQQRALSQILARRYGTANLPTGAGKTVLALAVIAARKQPTLVLVHNKELLHQWQDRIRQFLGIEAGLIGGGKFEIGLVTVAVINTARNRLAELQGRFGHIVVDECHRCPTAMFSEVVAGLDAKYLLGLSATMFRRDGLNRLIHLYLGDKVAQVSEAELRESGAILKPEVVRRFTDFRYSYDDDYSDMISALTRDEKRNQLIVTDVAANTNGSGTALVVSDRVDHCQAMAGMLLQEGLTVEVLTGSTRAQDRTRIVEAVQAGRVNVLVSTTQLIGEGFDCSGLCDLYLTTPIRFQGRLTQVVGRILRPAEGKQARVFDYVDHHVGLLAHQAECRWKEGM